ncbi:dihydropteroate synthase [Desulfuromonas thiophila]|uniref:dihydropteroate synthase n=1 Tax=Desulfuromonas thiophila TaxID=57664 RepID=UPI0029F54A19|nr:dihydropteroate synthase [Desulfuromonas thiophila]
MKRREFQRMIGLGPLLLDAPASPASADECCTAALLLEQSGAIVSDLKQRKAAGCDLLCCPSGALNRLRLAACGQSDQASGMNRELMRRCRVALGDVPVFGVCSASGRRVDPFGELDFEDAVSCYLQQGKALAAGGASGFIVSGMSDIQEARAALIALRELGDLPVMVQMAVNAQGHSVGGSDPLAALVTLQSLGADAVGFSASAAGISLAAIIARLKPSATVPIWAVPPVSATDPEQYAATGAALLQAGANLLGVDHHASSDHLTALAGSLHRCDPQPVARTSLSAVSSCRNAAFLGQNYPFAVVGERINPTGKKLLQASLRQGNLDLVQQFALEQEQRQATILDVNMGLSGIDEEAMMLKAIGLLSNRSPLPLCIDTTRPEVMEAALRRYPGRALVNSVSGERERIERTLPAAARYGAMFIVLPLTDAGIPETARERITVIDSIMEAAASYGCTVDDIAVDGLVMTISSNPEAAKETLDLISWCSGTLHANTIAGLSNVSFGMPERQWINGAFLGMAMGRGLTMAIANPSSDSIMATVQAYNAFWGHDTGMLLQSGAFTGAAS